MVHQKRFYELLCSISRQLLIFETAHLVDAYIPRGGTVQNEGIVFHYTSKDESCRQTTFSESFAVSFPQLESTTIAPDQSLFLK